MKKYLVLIPLLAGVVALGAVTSGIVFGKGHVPAGKAQVCHKNSVVLEIGAASVADHVAHGDTALPACDFNNVFHKGDSCGGPLAPRADAGGITPACPPGTF